MSPTDILEQRVPAIAGGGPLGPRGGGEGDGYGASPSRREITRFGIWLLLGTVSMMFVGFTSAYMVRRAAADWRALPLPPVLAWNTLALLASSVCLQLARRALKSWDMPGAQRFFSATGLLGGLFAAGQVLGWRQLAAQGVFLHSNPHSSFFFLLSGVHLAHLAGGLIWFGAAWSRLRRMAYAPGEDGLGLFAIYWHFLGALWAYLLLLLYVL
jgi:cytochrome c oxidase subunit 3